MVSILLLSWNHEKYIRQAVNSLVAQTYKDIEIIYLDNCSDDDSYSKALDILHASGIKYEAHRREKPYPTAKNLNYILSRSSGEFISVSSGDDWLHPDSISNKMKYINAPGVGMVYSDGYKYYEDIDIYEPFEGEHFEVDKVLDEMYKRNYISALGCIIRRSVFEDVGNWDELLLVEDTDLWIRIASKYRIIHLKEKLFYYRKHANAISSNHEHMYKAKLELAEKYKTINPHHELLLKNAFENYLAGLVQNSTSVSTFRKVIKSYKPNIFYSKLLIKSLLPVKLKKWYFKKGLLNKFKN